MEIIRIRSYLKKIKWYLLWLFAALGIVTIIFIIIFLALKNMSSQDKLIYCSIFLVVNLIRSYKENKGFIKIRKKIPLIYWTK